MLKNIKCILICFLLLFQVTAAEKNSIAILTCEMTSTFNCIGIIIKYKGDDNGSFTAKVYYREKKEKKWIEGYPLVRIPGKRFAGSIFGLKPDTTYEAEVRFEGVDVLDNEQNAKNTYNCAEIITRSEKIPVPTGNTIFVTPADDMNKLFKGVKPGQTVIFKKGVYAGGYTLRVSGTENEPIILKSETPGEAVLDGFDPAYAPDWKIEGAETVPWSACEKEPVYIAEGEVQLYRYAKYEDLKLNPAKAKSYWYYGEKEKKLYCFYDNKNKLNISFTDALVRLESANNIIVDGFSMRYAGTAVKLKASSDNWIINNNINNCGGGIKVYKYTSRDNVIEKNQLTDTSITSWEWKYVKATYFERSGISLGGGSGNIVRRNKIKGFFNGIGASTWSELYEEKYNRDIDVYENEIWDIGDDGWEPEGACINTRFWGNKLYDILHPFSLAPITVGPTYVIRNIAYNFRGGSGAFKFNVGIDKADGNMFIFHNTCYTAVPDVNALTLSGNIPPSKITFRNNILCGVKYTIEDMTKNVGNQLDLDYNLWYKVPVPDSSVIKWKNERFKSFAEWQKKTGKELHGMLKEPAFFDTSKNDFRLKPESPAVDAGLILQGINTDFKGKAPDLGALEIQ